LFAAAQERDALTSAVVGSGAAAFPLEVTGDLKQIIEAPDLDALRAVDGRDVVANALTLREKYEPSDTARQDYLESYAGTRFAESAEYVRSYPPDLEALRELLPEIRTPVQIIAGVPPEHTYRLAAALAANEVPHTVHVFAHGPHSLGLAEDAGDAAMWTTLAASWLTEQTSRASSALHAA
jgi:hypothetical protein